MECYSNIKINKDMYKDEPQKYYKWKKSEIKDNIM